MTSTYVNDLRLNELATGDGSGTWGDTTNTNLELIGEALSFGTEAITTNADTHTSTVADGATDPARSMFIKYTGTLDSACTITIAPNTLSRVHFIENATSGSQNIIIKQGSGATVTIAPGDVKAVYLDGAGSGAAVVDAFASLSVVDLKVGDDLTLNSDSAILGFGADTDTTLTHTDGTGLTLNSTNKLTFGDVASFVQQSSDGVLRIDGEATIDLNASTAVTVSNDLKLDSDSSVLGFGADNDTTLTHTDGTGLTLNSTNKLTFGDAASFVQQSSDGVLRIDGEATIDLNASTAVTVSNDLKLDSDSAVLGFGADNDITITHDPDDGLFFKSAATADDNPFVLTLQTGETDIAADDKLGVIDFQAPDEAAGTDAVLVAAGIEAISEGDFSASSNATSLVFKTGASEAATEKVRIKSNGRVGIGVDPSNDLHIKSSNPVIRLEDSDGSSSIYAQMFSDASGKLTFRADPGNAAGSSKINFEIDGSEVQSIDASGHILKPLNSAFSAVLAADLDNKTGDGTTFTIDSTLGASFTEIYDKNSDFSNGIFTAPVTGRYLLHCAIFMDGFTANHNSGILRFTTSNRNYDFFYNPRNYANVGTNLHAHATVIADMDSTDTARISVFVGSTDKTVDIKTASITRFAGELLG